MKTYRERIYAQYSSARDEELAPTSIGGLRSRAPYLTKLIRDHFPTKKDSIILDLGCGYGALIYYAKLSGYTNIQGIDISPEQVSAARKLGIEGVFEGDAWKTFQEQTDGSVDAIVTFDVIEHFTREELVQFIDEVYRVLTLGGKWIIHAPNGEGPFASRIRFGDLTHEIIFTRISIAQILFASGFSQVQSFEDAPIPHGLVSIIRWILWKLIHLILRFYIAIETGNLSDKTIFSQNFLTVAVK